MTKTRYSDHWKEWDRFTKSVESNVDDLAHLAPAQLNLSKVLSNVRDLTSQQDSLRASKQEISKQLREAMQEGRRTAHFLRVGIIHHYGASNEKLAEFGLQPFRSRSRKQEPAELPPPAPAPEPGSAE